MAQRSEVQSNKSSESFPLDDLSYDLVTLLHEKSKGLEAYDKYLRDAADDSEAQQLLEQLRQQDTDAVEQLKECVVRALGQNADEDGETSDDTATDEDGNES